MVESRERALMLRRSGRLLADVRARLGARTLVVTLALALLSTLLEGGIIAFLVPLLSQLGLGETGAGNLVVTTADRALAAVGLPASLAAYAGSVAVLALLRFAVLAIYARISARVRYGYVQAVRDSLFSDLLGARWALFWTERTGELTSTVSLEAERSGNAVHQALLAVSGALTAFLYAFVAFAASWTASLVVAGAGAVVVLVGLPILRRTQAVGEEIGPRFGAMTAITEETLNGAKFIKASASERDAIERFRLLSGRLSDLLQRNQYLGGLLTSFFESSAAVLVVAVFVVGTQVLGVPPLTVVVVAGLMARLYPRLAAVQQSMQALAVYLPSSELIAATAERAHLLAEPLQEAEPLLPGAIHPPLSVEVCGLVVRYGEVLALRHVDLVLEPGRVTALAGTSGSGKSTLANCLLRLVDWEEGAIRVNGLDLCELPLSQWRRRVGYVAQETVLFHASVRENLAWGHGDVAMEQIEAAARAAGAHEFIMMLDDGYDSVVGDRGMRLSGGQRQRLGLARALLGDPALLVLDEATSSLDADSERSVLHAVEQLRGTVTVLVIAHRLASLRAADHVYVFEGGAVAESGTWAELVANDQRFAKMLRLQNTAQ